MPHQKPVEHSVPQQIPPISAPADTPLPTQSTPPATSPPPSTHDPKKSPGLHSRGINIKTGERDTNNAVIAAAALAAAADIPLPLLKKKEPAVKVEATQDAVPDTIGPENSNNGPRLLESGEFESKSVLADVEASKFVSPETKIKEIVIKTPFRPPPLASYQVDPDSGLIGCICGIEDDDGFTIQCDVCFRWQHCLCMDFKTNEEVPEDEYKCYYCDEAKWGKFNPEACKQETLDRLANEKSQNGGNGAAVNGTTTEPVAPVQQPKLKRKHLTTGNEENKRKKQDKSRNVSSSEKSLEPNKSNGDVKVNDDIKPITTDLQSTTKTEPPIEPPTVDNDDFLPNKDNELLEDGISAEFYQSVYYKLRQNDHKNSAVKQQLEDIGSKFFHNIDKNPLLEIMTLTQFQNLKLSKVILPNHQKYLQDRNEFRRNKGFNKTSVQIKSYGDNPKQRFNGITRLGLFISERVPSQSEFTISKDTPIIEYLGEVNFFTNYRDNRTNQYSTWGTTKPRVVKTSLKLDSKDVVDVVLDSRFVGNEARFIRKSCLFSANCYIKPIYIPQTNNFRYMIYTSKDIVLTPSNSEEELRLDWDWDPKHPILKMNNKVNPETNEITEGLKLDQFGDEEKALLISGIDNILQFVECGCTTSSQSHQCAMFKIKKATSYLLRSTRKASGMSNIQLAKAREELTKPKKTREFISWNERLVERDQVIQMKLSITTMNDESEENEGDKSLNGKEQTEDERLEDDNEREDDETVSDGASNLSKKLSYQVPFKDYLITKGKKRLQQLQSEAKKNDNTESRSENKASFIVPIAPEVVVEIKQSVGQEIKPSKLVESSIPISETNVVKEETGPSPQGNALADKAEADSNNAPIKTKNPAVPQHPVVVKKLSFADYKKKMK